MADDDEFWAHVCKISDVAAGTQDAYNVVQAAPSPPEAPVAVPGPQAPVEPDPPDQSCGDLLGQIGGLREELLRKNGETELLRGRIHAAEREKREATAQLQKMIMQGEKDKKEEALKAQSKIETLRDELKFMEQDCRSLKELVKSRKPDGNTASPLTSAPRRLRTPVRKRFPNAMGGDGFASVATRSRPDHSHRRNICHVGTNTEESMGTATMAITSTVHTEANIACSIGEKCQLHWDEGQSSARIAGVLFKEAGVSLRALLSVPMLQEGQKCSDVGPDVKRDASHVKESAALNMLVVEVDEVISSMMLNRGEALALLAPLIGVMSRCLSDDQNNTMNTLACDALKVLVVLLSNCNACAAIVATAPDPTDEANRDAEAAENGDQHAIVAARDLHEGEHNDIPRTLLESMEFAHSQEMPWSDNPRLRRRQQSECSPFLSTFRTRRLGCALPDEIHYVPDLVRILISYVLRAEPCATLVEVLRVLVIVAAHCTNDNDVCAFKDLVEKGPLYRLVACTTDASPQAKMVQQLAVNLLQSLSGFAKMAIMIAEYSDAPVFDQLYQMLCTADSLELQLSAVRCLIIAATAHPVAAKDMMRRTDTRDTMVPSSICSVSELLYTTLNALRDDPPNLGDLSIGVKVVLEAMALLRVLALSVREMPMFFFNCAQHRYMFLSVMSRFTGGKGGGHVRDVGINHPHVSQSLHHLGHDCGFLMKFLIEEEGGTFVDSQSEPTQMDATQRL